MKNNNRNNDVDDLNEHVKVELAKFCNPTPAQKGIAILAALLKLADK
jgi:hypothetical protein